MRSLIFGAAALLAVAVPGMAAAQTGYVGVTYANVDPDNGDNTDAYGVEGAVAFSGSSQISFEVDASYSDGSDVDSTWGVAGHVFTRNDQYLFGGFVAVSDNDAAGTTWEAGLEANKYFEQWTLAGAIAYANNDDNNADGWGVNVQGRYFPTDNVRLQANVGWLDADGDDATVVGVGGEYQFTAVPISIGAGYNHLDTDGPDANTWTLAVRYNFGGGTLRDRDRSGASQADLIGFGFRV